MESRQQAGGRACSLRPAQLHVVPGSLEGICAERLEVSREGANRQLGAEGKTGVPRSGVLFGDTGSGESVSWGWGWGDISSGCLHLLKDGGGGGRKAKMEFNWS